MVSRGGYARAWVGGNIGSPLIADVDEMQPDDLAVMELSSFQLELMTRSPQVAAILNITPNHLDRHGTMEAYTAAKGAHPALPDLPGIWQSWAAMTRARGRWRPRCRGPLLSFGFSELAEDQAGRLSAGRWHLPAPGPR